jgi:hypothetical protein
LGKLFISYRREDAPGDARGICDRLGRAFGRANVFMDVDNLLAGQRFDRELDKGLSKCDVLVAVIGSRWVELLSEHAQRGKRDYVRDEIAAALTRDIIVIPVMIGHEAHMPPLPPAEDLPENIRDLVLYQKHSIAHESFGRDAAHLIEAIKAVLRERRGPRPRWAIAAAAVIVMVVIGALGGYLMGVIPRSAPSVTQHVPPTNGSTAAAPLNSDAVSKRAEQQEAKEKAEAEAKAADDAAARKKADDEAAQKAAEEAKRQAEADAAARKKADDEAAQKAAEEAKWQAEADAAKKKADEEAVRKNAAEHEAALKAAELRAWVDGETKRQAAAAAAKKTADEEAARTEAGSSATPQWVGIPPSILAADATLLGQFSDWRAYAVVRNGKKICFAFAGHLSSKNDDAAKHDRGYAFVSIRPSENVLNEFSITTTYQVKQADGSALEIGNERYALYGKGNGLWIWNRAEEPRLIDSMRTSPELTIRALTSDGVMNKEVYSLRGFGQAIDRVARECR